MKYILFTLTFSLISFFVQAQSIDYFEGSPEELFEYAHKKKKKVIIDFYTSWCGYCKKLDKTTFIDPAVVSYVNKNYVMYKLDAESDFGRPLARNEQITGYPCIIFYDYNKNVIGRINGYVDAPKFQEYLVQLNDVKTVATVKEPVVSAESNVRLDELFNPMLDSLRLLVLSEYTVEQQEELVLAESFGVEKNVFEFDELTYQLSTREEVQVHEIMLPLFFSMGQGISRYVNSEAQELFEKEQLSFNGKLFMSLYLVTVHKGNLLSLQLANSAVLQDPSYDALLIKTLAQQAIGDKKDAIDTAKKAKKIASKQKLDAILLETILSF